MKNDDRTSPAQVAVQLGASTECVVTAGDLPRVCAPKGDWAMVCKNRDGSRPHEVQVRCASSGIEIVVLAPEGKVRVAELPRPDGALVCGR